MKKYLIIALIIIASICIGFFLYKVNHPGRINQGSNTSQNTNNLSVQESNISDVISDISDQERNTAEILFIRPVSKNIFKVCTIGIDGKNLKELFTVDNSVLNSNPIYSTLIQGGGVVTTDQTNVNYIKNNLGKFKNAFTHPLHDLSKNFYAYPMPIEESDIATSADGKGISGNVVDVFKGVYLCNVETGKTVRLDKDLVNQMPDSSFSKDGSLFVTCLSFSHDGKFLFVTSIPNYLSIFSMEQMKFIEIFNTNDVFAYYIHNVDKALNSLYILAGTDSSNVYKFDMDKKELKPLTNCPESTFSISPDNQSLVFTETYIDGKSDLGILNLENGTLKRIDYPKGGEIAGFVLDSKHLIIKRSTDINYHIAIYLLNLNTLKEAKIYAETGS